MQFCSKCGASNWEYLKSGGCGGNGQIKGCKICGAVFVQKSGGIVATPGGETWSPLGYTLDEYRKRVPEKPARK